MVAYIAPPKWTHSSFKAKSAFSGNPRPSARCRSAVRISARRCAVYPSVCAPAPFGDPVVRGVPDGPRGVRSCARRTHG